MFPSLTSAVTLVAQEQIHEGPQGPEFGKAAPVGLLVIVALLVVILTLGFMFNRRMRRMHKRRDFAEAHGLDPFDIETIDRRMAEEEAMEAAAAAPRSAPSAGSAGSAGSGTTRSGRPTSYWDEEPDAQTSAEASTEPGRDDGPGAPGGPEDQGGDRR